MKKARKVIAMVLVLALTVAMSVAGTIAYLMDTDSAVNTMTVGNVAIEQTEWQRVIDGSGDNTFEPFQQNKLLMPGVYDSVNANWKVSYADDETLKIDDGNAWNGFWGVEADGYEWNGVEPVETYNAQDKIVVVKNTGNQPVYYRTIIALEKGDAKLLLNVNGNAKFEWNDYENKTDKDSAMFQTKINDKEYSIWVATYKPELAPDEVCRPSLLQVMIDKSANNEEVASYGEDGITILALSQAVQAAGFQDANEALNEAFGEVTAEAVTGWFETEAPAA